MTIYILKECQAHQRSFPIGNTRPILLSQVTWPRAGSLLTCRWVEMEARTWGNERHMKSRFTFMIHNVMVSKNTQIRTQKKCSSTCKGVTPGPTHLKLTGSFKSSLSWSLLLSRLPRSAWRPTSLLWAAGSCKSYSTLSKKAGKVFLWTQLSTLPSPWW